MERTKKIIVLSGIVVCMSYFVFKIAEHVKLPLLTPSMQCSGALPVAYVNNPDIDIPAYAGIYTKGFVHDAQTGLLSSVGIQQFKAMLHDIQHSMQFKYDGAAQAAITMRKFPDLLDDGAACNVQVPEIVVSSPPSVTSPEACADLIENYLMAIARVVKFSDYGTGRGTDLDTINGGSITLNACKILQALPGYTGPKINGEVTPAVLFRANFAGIEVGPYVSQFELLDIYRYDSDLLPVKQHMPIKANHTYGVTWQDFIRIQNGEIPDTIHDFDGTVHYMLCGNDLGTFVHGNTLLESFMNAKNILLNNRSEQHKAFALAKTNPYFKQITGKQHAANNFWYTDLVNLMWATHLQALKVSWQTKWHQSLRIRPEEMAGLVHQAKTTGNNTYHLDMELFGSIGGIDLLNWVKTFNQQQNTNSLAYATYLLAQEFPEGCPMHPSYLSDHATTSGAVATVMKAFIDDTALFSIYATPMIPDPSNPLALIAYTGADMQHMTVGGELNKLASNVAFARNFAGVHYRTDSQTGLQTGELVAILYLQEWARLYAEHGFDGFELTKFNGQRIRILPDAIVEI